MPIYVLKLFLSFLFYFSYSSGHTSIIVAFLLYDNDLVGRFPSEIGKMNELELIDMENNGLVGTIPDELYTNLKLREVVLKNNSLSGIISNSIGDLSGLTEFWASYNDLSGTIPTTFGRLARLGMVLPLFPATFKVVNVTKTHVFLPFS